MPDRSALGLIETRGLVGAIEASDAAAKAAEVVITCVEVTPAALVTVKMEGELGAVQASVAAAAAAAGRVGELISAHVIARPDDELDKILSDTRFVNPSDPKHQAPDKRIAPAEIPADDTALEAMTVADLRRLAREQADFPIAGREVSRANKDELLQMLRSYRDRQQTGSEPPASPAAGGQE